jgi:hypothetical protein
MNFKPKLVAFDLDGTLAESKQPVSVETGELLSELLSHMPVAIMSGAGFGQFENNFCPHSPTQSILSGSSSSLLMRPSATSLGMAHGVLSMTDPLIPLKRGASCKRLKNLWRRLV